MSMIRPKELTLLDIETGQDKALSNINDDLYQDLDVATFEERWIEATDGEKIHCWVIYPPGFKKDDGKKWPFGRKWNDDISGDWGGQAMKDILSVTDVMVKEPYVDSEKVGAIGASFGGYTVYWLMGNHGDRFQTMIAHCGVFNLESMYGSTEELFFVNWDLGGPYWKSPDVKKEYDLFSPHRFVKNWKTPLLVIHGQKDFRVPVTQGMEAFTEPAERGPLASSVLRLAGSRAEITKEQFTA